MSTFKKAKVVMLPTNQKAKEGMIYLKPKIGIFNETSSENHNNKVYDCNPQHLYIISDDEIKEGDWYIAEGKIYRASVDHMPELYKHSHKKIIATTDESLNLPQPSKQFIQKYIEEYDKGNIIEDILVEYEIKSNAGLGHNEWVNLQHIEGKRYLPVKIKANTHQDTYELGKEDILEDFEIEINLKINPKDNTITIKKAKDSWNREEVENLIYSAMKDRCYTTIAEWKKWIKENL